MFKRIEIEPEVEIGAERADERCATSFALPARQAREGHQQCIQHGAFRCLAEDVQAVADLRLLQLAQMIVELGQCRIGVVAGQHAAIGGKPARQREIEDLALQIHAAARIDLARLEIFIDQPLEIAQRAVAFGAGQRRRHVIDDHRLGAALGLRAFAGIVDDEGIEMRHRPEDRLRITISRQRQGFPRQPFEIAVLAHMDDRVRAELPAQIGIEGEIAMRRDEVGVVIARRGVDVIAARRLDADDDLPQRDAAADRKPRSRIMRIGLWPRPSGAVTAACIAGGSVAKKAA